MSGFDIKHISPDDPLCEAKFARSFASTDFSDRQAAIDGLAPFLSKLTNDTSVDFMKLWKGIFFTVWHADGEKQWDAACTSAGLLSSRLSTPSLFEAWIAAGYRTLARQWIGIDKWRLHKFYLLCRHLTRGALLTAAERGWDVQHDDPIPAGMEGSDIADSEAETEAEDAASATSAQSESGSESGSGSAAELEDVPETNSYLDALISAWRESFAADELISGACPASLFAHMLSVFTSALGSLAKVPATVPAATAVRTAAGLEDPTSAALPALSALDTLDGPAFSSLVLFWVEVLPAVRGVPAVQRAFAEFFRHISHAGSVWQKEGLIEPLELYEPDPEVVSDLRTAWAKEGASETDITAFLAEMRRDARLRTLAGTLQIFVADAEAAAAAFRAEMEEQAKLAPSKRARAKLLEQRPRGHPNNLKMLRKFATALADVATIECPATNAALAARFGRIEGREIDLGASEPEAEPTPEAEPEAEPEPTPAAKPKVVRVRRVKRVVRKAKGATAN